MQGTINLQNMCVYFFSEITERISAKLVDGVVHGLQDDWRF
jgi:hypothetical protein